MAAGASDPSHPLAGKTKILYNTFAESGVPENKWVSFAFSAAPSGVPSTGKEHWLRATYTAVNDAMPTLFSAVAGQPHVYTLQNVWPGATGYLCASKSPQYSFLRSNCSAAEAMKLKVTVPDIRKPGIHVMQAVATSEYVSFCDSGCSGGRWLAASYTSLSDAMTLNLTDPGVVPPSPPTPPKPAKVCVENGTAHYVCESSGYMDYDSHLSQIFGSALEGWDGYNPICPGGGMPPLPSPPPEMCTNGVGTQPPLTPCHFPFVYKNATYTSCAGSTGEYAAYGWCATTADMDVDGKWGGCRPCEEDWWEAHGCTKRFPSKQPQDGWMTYSYNPEVMHQFSPAEVPIHTWLAQQYALFDSWFTSFPGPSTPNHLFLMTASSGGCTTTGEDYQCVAGRKFPQKTIFEAIAEAGHTWRYFYNDTSWNYFLEWFNTPAGAAGVVGYDEFYHRARTGELPNFSFILPREGTNTTTGEGSNDDHPCHDIALGERLIKDTYEAVRASPAWNRTMLLVVYDDTGGWYDHAPVPLGVPPPDEHTSCSSATKFDWLGLRSPTLMISPWVSKGKVIHKPTGPTPTSQYEHSSVAATLKSLFGLESFLTKRDAWAGDVSKELDQHAPRTDCPLHAPKPPPPSRSHQRATHGGVDPERALTRRQLRRIRGLARANGVPVPAFALPGERGGHYPLHKPHETAEAWLAAQEAVHRSRVMNRDEL
jgi:hypothetical protein